MAPRTKSRQERLRFSSTNRKKEKRSQFLRLLLRLSAWVTLTLLCVALLGGMIFGLRVLLLTSNDHFRLRKVEIDIYGNREISTEQVRRRLREIGVIEQNVNLFEINLANVRNTLRNSEVSINHVSVRRRLPDTLKIIVRQRDAVAQLVSPKGLLLDRSGLVIPDSNNPRTWALPVITGLQGGQRLRPGDQLDDPLANSALRLVLLIRSGYFSQRLNVDFIQLDYSAEALKVYVNGRRPFRKSACIVLPADETEMEAALARLRVIIQERLNGQQPIQFVDATYKTNIPVRP